MKFTSEKETGVLPRCVWGHGLSDWHTQQETNVISPYKQLNASSSAEVTRGHAPAAFCYHWKPARAHISVHDTLDLSPWHCLLLRILNPIRKWRVHTWGRIGKCCACFVFLKKDFFDDVLFCFLQNVLKWFCVDAIKVSKIGSKSPINLAEKGNRQVKSEINYSAPRLIITVQNWLWNLEMSLKSRRNCNRCWSCVSIIWEVMTGPRKWQRQYSFAK